MSARRTTARLQRWKRWLGTLALGLVVVASVVVVSSGEPIEAAAPPAGVTVTVTPTSELIDGQKVTVNIKASADVVINQAYVKQCRLNATYEVRDDVTPAHGACPPSPVTSSADDAVIRDQEGFFVLSRTADGLNIPYRIGVGSTEWEADGQRTLTCGPNDSCALVVRLRIAGVYSYSVTHLDFVDSDPIAACGGASKSILTSAGSDEMADAWAKWTREFCGIPGGDGAPTIGTFGGGEGPAVTGFSSGLNDLAYTATAYAPDVGLIPSGSPTRSAVAIPVALNAAVFATGSGGIATVNSLPVGKVKYPTLQLANADAAALVTGGIPWVDRPTIPYRDSILQRNPLLGGVLYYGGGSAGTNGVYASSLPLSSTFFMTQYLTTKSPGDFAVPGTTTTRPATSNFALANPAYSDALQLVSGRPPLTKVANAALLDERVAGPLWTVTDLATAKALDMGTVAIGDAGTFVEPNAATLAAAVPLMTRDAQGLLRPDPNAAVGTAAAGDAYPLTYVVYALAPAEPLYTEDCHARSASQELLAKWLTYITGDGQAFLGSGLQPLTPELRTEAQAAISKVGASSVTGACAPAATPPAPAAGSFSTGAPSVGTPTVPSSNVATPSRLPTSTATSGSGAGSSSSSAGSGSGGTTKIAAVPTFSSRLLPDTMGGVVALIGIALVSSLGIYLTAKLATGGGTAMQGEGGFVELGGQRVVAALVALWIVVGIAGVALVVYQLGPLLEQRDQRALSAAYVKDLRAAAFASEGISLKPDRSAVTPPEPGAAVGFLEIGEIGLQGVVVEGISPAETANGPGHVPGTAGLGQPGNSAIVARRNGYGGPFAELGTLKKGDAVLVTTTQGQSVYKVKSVEEDRPLGRGLFGASKDDRLTLITSATASPTNSDRATVVVATMRDLPFEPTAQGARTKGETTVSGESNAWPRIALTLAVYAAVLAGSVFVYRRFRFVVAYALTVAPIVAATVLLAENVSLLMPSWT